MFLRQGTPVTVNLGPFVSQADGFTAKGALNPAPRLSKNGGAWGARNSAGAIAHTENGWYSVPLNDVDVGTVGRLMVAVTDAANHLPVWHVYTVLPPAVFDALVAGTDTLHADVTELGGDAQSATDLKDFADAGYDPAGNVLADARLGNLDAAVSTRATGAALVQAVVDLLAAIATRADGAAYTPARAALLDRLDVAISTRLAGNAYAAPPTVEAIVNAVLDELLAEHEAPGSVGEAIGNAGAAGDPLNIEVPGDYPRGTAGWALGRIGRKEILVTAPVVRGSSIEIIRGDSYLHARERSLEWLDVNGTWPAFDDAEQIVFKTEDLTKEVEVVSAELLRLELTSEETAALEVRGHRYDIEVQYAAEPGEEDVTIVQGSLEVKADVETPEEP